MAAGTALAQVSGKTAWPLVPLGDLLVRRQPDVLVDPTRTYMFAGVYCFGRGVFRSQAREGAEFSYRYVTQLRTGDFVYPKLMAWEGAFGVVPDECDGCYVSPEFPVFSVRAERVVGAFLGYYFRVPSVWQAIAGGSIGTNVRRRRLHPDDFATRSIPLPPLPEQRRIVAKLNQLAAKVEQARELRRDAPERIDLLVAAEEQRVWPPSSLEGAPRLEEVTRHAARGRQSEQGESDHVLIKTQHVQQGRYVPSALRLAAQAAAKVDPAGIAQDGDILIACSAAGCLGRVARYRSSGGPASTDTHVAIVRANPAVIDPDYLYGYLLGDQGQHQLRSRERGDWRREKIGFRLTELNLKDLKSIPVPLPTKEEQRRIVQELSRIRATAEGLKQVQARTSAELDALMPAILDRAFRGEL
jgi:type I restriction enzyme, S subunit